MHRTMWWTAPALVLAACGIDRAGAPGTDTARAAITRSDGGVSASAIVSGRRYRLANGCSGKLLRVAGGDTANGARVVLWGDDGGTDRQWRADAQPDGSWRLTAVHSGKVLDVVGVSTASEADVQQWGWGNGANQRWRIADAPGGTVTLQSVNSGLQLDARWAGTTDGTRVWQYTANGSCAQQWTLTDVTPPIAGDTSSFRAMADARRMRFGTEVNLPPIRDDAQYRALLTREFNHIQPGNACMAINMRDGRTPWQLRLDGRGRVEPFDSLVDFAEANGQTVQCFHLIWYLESRWGRWLDSLSVDDKRRFVDTHVTQVIGRYRGRVEAWNVVNEAFTDQGTIRPYEGGEERNWLAALGEGYIEQAFRSARAADPTAKLFYNDYGMEWDGAGTNAKWKKVLAMVRDFRTRGVPIDGVGFQSHVQIADGNPPTERNPEQFARELAGHFRDLAALGLQVRITEMDVRIDMLTDRPLADRLALQARFYKAFLNACLQATNCTGFSTWGVSDKYSWLIEPGWGGSPATAPLPWDANFQPKPAYYSLRDAFLGR